MKITSQSIRTKLKVHILVTDPSDVSLLAFYYNQGDIVRELPNTVTTEGSDKSRTK